MTGATVTVDGITNRPDYAYQPPAAFFAEGEPTGADVFNVLDFGAVADPTVDNTPMIQAAVQAAHDAGGGIVYLPPGVFGIAAADGHNGAIEILSNVFIKGAGMGQSTLRVVDGNAENITGIIRSPHSEATVNYGIGDLTLDGNRDNGSGEVFGFYTGGAPGSPIADEDVYVLRAEAQNNSGYGFDPHEQTHRLHIKDSVAHDNGLDGFVADYLVDSHYEGNVAYDNDRHGFNVVTATRDFLLTDNIAYGNGSTGFVIQRGSEDIALPENIVIRGGQSFGNAREGILIKMSKNVLVEDVDVHDNGRHGIRLQGADNVTVRNNTVEHNGQAAHDNYAEILIGDYFDATTGQVFGAFANLIDANGIRSSGDVRARYGIEERNGETGDNIVTNNQIAGPVRGHVKLVGPGSYREASGDEAANLLTGTGTQDHIQGLAGDDTIYGKDGNDWLQGGAGHDWFSGGKHDDIIDGGDGNDIIKGDSGDDHLRGGAGNDDIKGGSGDDIITDDSGDNILDGGSGNDIITASGGGSNTINGRSGDDTLLALDGDTVMKGSSGNDHLQAASGTNRLEGGSGNDTIIGGSGADTIKGGNDDDVIDAGAGDDIVSGGKGDDVIVFSGDIAATGNDVIDGNSGFDTLDFSALTGAMQPAVALRVDIQSDTAHIGDQQASINGIESVIGTTGNDELLGSHAAESLFGNAGDDVLAGAGGADLLDGGFGHDHLTGGADADTFRFDLIDGETDIIADFQVGADIIDFAGHGLAFADITIMDTNGSTLLSAHGHSIELIGVAPNALTEADFLL